MPQYSKPIVDGYRIDDKGKYSLIRFRWKREGHCTGCGHCCNIKAYPGRPFVINNEVSFGADGYCVLMDKKTMLCTIYPKAGEKDKRPAMCREFPYGPRDLAIFPECSYRFVKEYIE